MIHDYICGLKCVIFVHLICLVECFDTEDFFKCCCSGSNMHNHDDTKTLLRFTFIYFDVSESNTLIRALQLFRIWVDDRVDPRDVGRRSHGHRRKSWNCADGRTPAKDTDQLVSTVDNLRNWTASIAGARSNSTGYGSQTHVQRSDWGHLRVFRISHQRLTSRVGKDGNSGLLEERRSAWQQTDRGRSPTGKSYDATVDGVRCRQVDGLDERCEAERRRQTNHGNVERTQRLIVGGMNHKVEHVDRLLGDLELVQGQLSSLDAIPAVQIAGKTLGSGQHVEVVDDGSTADMVCSQQQEPLDGHDVRVLGGKRIGSSGHAGSSVN